MPGSERALTVVREWVSKADNDLKTAAHTLKLGEECPADTVCSHAQRCVEKYIKAMLVWKAIGLPKTHEIAELEALLPPRS
ncbi:MAG: HEPN domain-containing protein [Planctomycetes bacterium]|nr:HEPN domain-containing protein [Planctomycetota bacterium]